MRRACATVLALLLPAATQTFARQGPQQGLQQGDVELRGDLVEIRAVVTDAQGRLVDNLTKQDFEVVDNGKPREISFFSVNTVPQGATATIAGPAPTTPAPAKPALPAPAVRSIVFFVDNANLSAGDLVRARKALRSFVDTRIADTDLAAIVESYGSIGLAGQFTRDRAVLREAIDKIANHPPAAGTGGFTPYLSAEIVRGTNEEALNAGAYLVRIEDKIPPPMDADVPGGDPMSNHLKSLARQRAHQVLAEATRQRRLTLASLNHAVDQLARTEGQKLLALVSDGFSLFDVGGEREVSELRAVVARAVRSGVVIYSITGAGLEPNIYTGPDDPLYPIPPQIFPGYAQASRRDLEDGVNAIAKDTGGEVFRNTNDLAGALGQMLDRNRTYYALAYYADSGDNGNHSIDVRLVGHPELVVRAQRGYDASIVRASAQPVVDALSAPEPLTGLVVTAGASVAAPVPDGAVVGVDVHIDGDRIAYEETGETHNFALEVATAFIDDKGATYALKVESLDGRLKSGAYKLARANGFRVNRQAALKPGKYQLRVSVREPSSGLTGTANAWVDVPDLARGNLALGRLDLTNTRLRVGDELVYAVSAFNAPAGATMRVSILQSGRVVFRNAWEPISAHTVPGPAGVTRLSGRLGLGGAPPGGYRLTIEVRRDANTPAVAQSIEFKVSN